MARSRRTGSANRGRRRDGAKLGILRSALAAEIGLIAPPPLRLLLLREGFGAPALGRLAEIKGVRAKARYCRQRLFLPRSFMHQRTAVAGCGPDGLFFAYVVRAAWCLLRLPKAVTGWLRARSQYRQSP